MANEFRDELKKLGNKQRFTFEGTFQKTGIKVASTKSGKHYKPTLLLKDVKYDNKRVGMAGRNSIKKYTSEVVSEQWYNLIEKK